MRISTSNARKHLSEIVTRVQNPREYCVLTRHDRPIAAVVSMAELKRIWTDQDMEDVRTGKRKEAYIWGMANYKTNAEAAEGILKIQMTRRAEREALALAGKTPIPGGEIAIDLSALDRPAPVKRRWWRKIWR
ncbi:MAG: type II toxin-antitoxin system Phd/YefM family antitoxin [Pseudomonadota bacterium]